MCSVQESLSAVYMGCESTAENKAITYSNFIDLYANNRQMQNSSNVKLFCTTRFFCDAGKSWVQFQACTQFGLLHCGKYFEINFINSMIFSSVKMSEASSGRMQCYNCGNLIFSGDNPTCSGCGLKQNEVKHCLQCYSEMSLSMMDCPYCKHNQSFPATLKPCMLCRSFIPFAATQCPVCEVKQDIEILMRSSFKVCPTPGCQRFICVSVQICYCCKRPQHDNSNFIHGSQVAFLVHPSISRSMHESVFSPNNKGGSPLSTQVNISSGESQRISETSYGETGDLGAKKRSCIFCNAAILLNASFCFNCQMTQDIDVLKKSDFHRCLNPECKKIYSTNSNFCYGCKQPKDRNACVLRGSEIFCDDSLYTEKKSSASLVSAASSHVEMTLADDTVSKSIRDRATSTKPVSTPPIPSFNNNGKQTLKKSFQPQGKIETHEVQTSSTPDMSNQGLRKEAKTPESSSENRSANLYEVKHCLQCYSMISPSVMDCSYCKHNQSFPAILKPCMLCRSFIPMADAQCPVCEVKQDIDILMNSSFKVCSTQACQKFIRVSAQICYCCKRPQHGNSNIIHGSQVAFFVHPSISRSRLEAVSLPNDTGSSSKNQAVFQQKVETSSDEIASAISTQTDISGRECQQSSETSHGETGDLGAKKMSCIMCNAAIPPNAQFCFTCQMTQDIDILKKCDFNRCSNPECNKIYNANLSFCYSCKLQKDPNASVLSGSEVFQDNNSTQNENKHSAMLHTTSSSNKVQEHEQTRQPNEACTDGDDKASKLDQVSKKAADEIPCVLCSAMISATSSVCTTCEASQDIDTLRNSQFMFCSNEMCKKLMKADSKYCYRCKQPQDSNENLIPGSTLCFPILAAEGEVGDTTNVLHCVDKMPDNASSQKDASKLEKTTTSKTSGTLSTSTTENMHITNTDGNDPKKLFQSEHGNQSHKLNPSPTVDKNNQPLGKGTDPPDGSSEKTSSYSTRDLRVSMLESKPGSTSTNSKKATTSEQEDKDKKTISPSEESQTGDFVIVEGKEKVHAATAVEDFLTKERDLNAKVRGSEGSQSDRKEYGSSMQDQVSKDEQKVNQKGSKKEKKSK